MKESIEGLLNRGLISKEEIGFDQIASHLKRADKDVSVAEANFDIDREASYNYAYLAMLRSGRVLMFSFGYRPTGNQQHKAVVLFSEIILGTELGRLISKFDRMRKFRNKFTYDSPGIIVSDQELRNALRVSKEFVRVVSDFIQKRNPQLNLL